MTSMKPSRRRNHPEIPAIYETHECRQLRTALVTYHTERYRTQRNELKGHPTRPVDFQRMPDRIPVPKILPRTPDT